MDDLISRQADTLRVLDINGLEEEIRCAMCENPMCTNRSCDGGCEYDKRLYDTIIKVLSRRIKKLQFLKSRKGKWLWDGDIFDWEKEYICSECGCHALKKDGHQIRSYFCPNCGLRMEEGDSDEHNYKRY